MNTLAYLSRLVISRAGGGAGGRCWVADTARSYAPDGLHFFTYVTLITRESTHQVLGRPGKCQQICLLDFSPANREFPNAGSSELSGSANRLTNGWAPRWAARPGIALQAATFRRRK